MSRKQVTAVTSFAKKMNDVDTLFRKADVSDAVKTAQLDSLRLAAKDADVSAVFGRNLDFSFNGGKLGILAKDGKTAIKSSGGWVGYLLKTGDLKQAIKEIDDTMVISDEASNYFRTVAKQLPDYNIFALSDSAKKMQKWADDLPADFPKDFKTAKEFEDAMNSIPKTKSTLAKFASWVGKRISIGKLAVFAAIGVTAYAIIKNHQDKVNGCYRSSLISGQSIQCKANEYSVTKVDSGNFCSGVHPVKDQTSDWATPDGNCLKACNNTYLNIPETDGELVAYTCVDMSFFEAFGDTLGDFVDDALDITKDVVDAVKDVASAPGELLDTIKQLAPWALGAGAVFATIYIITKNK